MSHPLIILGAGASFDYVRKGQEDPRKRALGKKPPLTNNLFSPEFSEIINRHQLGTLPATVASRLQQESFEGILKDIESKIGVNADRKKELISLQYYLQELFREVLNTYGGQHANNYSALVACIKDSGGSACVVNFNYDLLFEESLGIHRKENINTYISGDIKVIKIHGASNWVYGVDHFSQSWADDLVNLRDYLMENPNYLDSFAPSEPGVRDNYLFKTPDGHNYHFVPAIAVPLPGKTEFICPPRHIEVLIESIKKADKVLIVGWKAGDAHILDLIDEHARAKLPVTIVSGGGDTDLIKEIISSRERLYVSAEHAGFSNFLGSNTCKTFFGI